MSIYLITYRNYLEKLRILRFDDREGAADYSANTSNDVTAIVVTRPEDLKDVATKVLVAVHNVMCAIADGATPSPRAVQKFQDRAIAMRRTFDAMEKSAETPDVNSARHAKAAAPEKAPKAPKAPKTSKAEKASRWPAGRSPKSVAEFRQMRAGTQRAKILSMMDGSHTVAKIASAIGASDSLTASNIFCIWRDCGIGHTYDSDGRITATYPGKRGFADAVKEPAPGVG